MFIIFPLPDLYEPYLPQFELKPFAASVWIADGAEIRMRLGPLRLPFSTRMTVVRMPNGSVWIHSPITPAETLVDEVTSLGPVTDIVAPNSLHYSWVAPWSVRFPLARVWAAPDMGRAARALLPPHRILTKSPPPAWSDAFDQVILRAPRTLTEVDFLHRESRTAILTDAIENLDLNRMRSPFYRFLVRLAGSHDPDGRLPWELRRLFKHSRESNRAAVDQMLAWHAERIIVAHGRCYDTSATKELERAFRWL